MEQIVVYGGNKISGSVKIEGGKNACLPILAATILADDGITKLQNVPILTDVLLMQDILKSLNVSVEFNKNKNEITVDATRQLKFEAMSEYVSRMRYSVLLMGALLARNGRSKVALPGGCDIGKRPIDIHIKGFKALGAKVTMANGFVEAQSDSLTGTNITLDFPTVSGTENILLVAVKSSGTTQISNAAREPEIVQLADFLNKMGAKITGHGTDVIRIQGVKRLRATELHILQDRIVAGTFMIAAAMTEGNVLIENTTINENQPIIDTLRETGADITQEENGVRVRGSKIIKPVNIITAPHPGFPTDLQAPISALLATAKGKSVIRETIYENRFQHLAELSKMTADITVTNDVATIKGGALIGAELYASDLRSAAALILAGLKAEGVSYINNLEYLDRGYSRFHDKLQQLGADIKRVMVNDRIYDNINNVK